MCEGKKTGAVSENVPGMDPATGVVFIGGLFNGKCIGTVRIRNCVLMFPKGGIMQEELKMMLAKAGNNQRPEILFDELAEKYPYEEVQSFAEVF